MIVLLAVAYVFTAHPTTKAPSPDSCVVILHQQSRAVEQRHCSFEQGKAAKGTLYLVD
jgi:hypothetical protein